jgi:hypothetical protein
MNGKAETTNYTKHHEVRKENEHGFVMTSPINIVILIDRQNAASIFHPAAMH